jgi:EAL domain-containing protein (putative c-di-GMP-specific phosphodiesterase class I)
MKVSLPTMRYQPQFDNTGKCIGVESLTMWNHPVYGTIYPPLIFKLAEEEGFLLEYEENVFRAVIKDMDRLLAVLGDDAKISVNVTGHIIKKGEFENFLYSIKKDYPEYCSHILIEITEQAALSIDDDLIQRLTRIKDAGFRFGIDDFSMGSTSIKYLQHNIFELVKLDGVLVRDITTNTRSREIVSSIIRLSRELGINVLAEYVETEEQQQVLEEIGCLMYQGYLYSKAVVLDELEELEILHRLKES